MDFTKPLHSFKDPGYDQIEAGVEKELGLPSGIMASIRTRGEKSNADQVSSAGARSVYQIIPSTRAAFQKKYGVDAYAGPLEAAKVAGLHLKESFQRGGDWDQAVTEYHGGTDPANWGPKTRAYAGRAGRKPGKFNNGETYPSPGSTRKIDFDPEAYLNGTYGDELGSRDARAPLPPRDKPEVTPQTARLAVLGPMGTLGSGPISTAGNALAEVKQVEQGQEALQAKKDSYSTWDRLKAGFESNSLAAAAWRALDRQHFEASPEWAHTLASDVDLTKFTQNDTEFRAVMNTTSRSEYDQLKQELETKQQRQFIQYSGGSATGLISGLVGGLADPLGLAAGLGVGKAFQMAGVGARSLYLAGRMRAAAGSLVAEGAVGNVAVTAGLDLAGEHMNTTDYASAAAFGMGIGAMLAPLHLRGVRNQEVQRIAGSLAEQGAAAQTALRDRAIANVGGDEARVNMEMRRLDAADKEEFVKSALGDVPEEHRLFPRADAEGNGGDLLTANADLRKDVIERHGLDAMPDEGMRGMAAEMIARAERHIAANPIDEKALKTVLKLGDLEATSNALMSDASPLSKAVGSLLLENGQGAGGRRASAAIAAHVNERVYLRELAGIDNTYRLFRQSEGVGVLEDVWTGKARKQFNRRVFAEIEARSAGMKTGESNAAILQAADMLQRGYDLMRRSQQHVGTIGAARLGADSVGYQPHRISAALAAELLQNKGQRRAIAKIISQQLQSEANAYEVHDPQTGATTSKTWDKPFADRFASKYLDDAARRAQGGHEVPINIHDPSAADVVYDTAKALGLSAEDADKLLGKFSRGGAGHTKARLRLDLTASIPDGKGGTIQLMDLFNQDAVGLYRSYARRVSGEVALAQYGVMGKKGLEVIREAMRHTGAQAPALRAFDQVSAELLNMPFGEANHKWMDNARILTSLSRLGGMGFTQFGEYGNALPALGVSRTLSAIKDFGRLANEAGKLTHGEASTNAILRDLDNWSGGAGVTEFHFTRLYDVPDNEIQLYNGETVGIATRLIRSGGQLQATLSGHRMILGAQVRGMAEGITRKALEFARSGREDKALADMGIDAAMLGRLRSNLDAIAKFDSKGRLTDLDPTAGDLTAVELNNFRQAILRGSNQIIQHTFTGETGKWAHHGFVKMLTQFRTFGIISIEKQWGRNVANYGAMKSFAYLIGAMSFAAPITIARLHIKAMGMSGSDRDKYLRQNLTIANLARATMNYASASGLAGDVFDVGNGFASGWAGQDYADSVGLRGQGQGGVSDLVPALGAINDTWAASHGNPHKLKSLLPFSNLPYVQPMINAATK